MASPAPDFADYCCELLSSVGRCERKRMFGGYGISTDGLNIAIVADLGAGERLWLKANEETRGLYEAAGCERFTYQAKGVARSVNYYAAPDEAMESPQLMAPWARQALACALKAQASKTVRSRPATRSPARPAKPPARRPTAPKPSTRASRKSAKG
ncbi:MAG: TfoX/Sxy family protein [Ramlibacter sp.]|nr:TfoX/Sxy family protein [Ramlibacter sp.]MBX3658307.1 TfoX/Sxy family protein [Ramlibacter sp.]MCW5650040.1 TfoX/Sxy family protein [Ramlibacter sp.]